MNKKIDSILYNTVVEEKLASQEAVDSVIAKAPGAPGIVWLTELVDNKLIDEAATLKLLGAKLGIQYTALKEGDIQADLFDKVPLKVASHYQFLPVSLKHKMLTIAVYYPLDINVLDEIRFQLGYDINQVLTTKKDVLEFLRVHYGLGAQTLEKMALQEDPALAEAKKLSRTEVESIDKSGEEATISNLVNEIILDAYDKRATDIHIEPYRDQVRFRYRIDGILYDAKVSTSVRHFLAPILSRIKIMANLDIVEHRLPQDGQAVVRTKKQRLDLRVSFIPTHFGESVVIRILPAVVLYGMELLGFSEEDRTALEELLKRPNGIIFVTGPTGSGKTTTLYACLHKLNMNDTKIITIEDPIEYEMQGITQIQVNPQIGLDFAAGLRSMLRHDPDVIMVGEVRDFETAEIAIRVALTGHLVFSTIHTNSAASSIHRLMDIGIEPYLIHSSTIAFVAQRLIRVLCPKCKVPVENPEPALVNFIAYQLKMKDKDSIMLYKSVGCDACNNTGYHGRTAIYEILRVDDSIKDLIQKKASAGEIERAAVSRGMKTLLQDGLDKVVQGLTSVEEVVNIMPAGSVNVTADAKAMEEIDSQRSFWNEKRIYSRLNKSFPISFSIFKSMSPDKNTPMSLPGVSESDFWREHNAFSENISSGGLVFKYQLKLPVGTILSMKIAVPQSEYEPVKVISCLARVVRVDRVESLKTLSVAVCFLDMSAADRMVLNKFVKSELKEPEDDGKKDKG